MAGEKNGVLLCPKGKNIKNFVSAVEFNIKIHKFYAGDFKGQQIFSKSEFGSRSSFD